MASHTCLGTSQGWQRKGFICFLQTSRKSTRHIFVDQGIFKHNKKVSKDNQLYGIADSLPTWSSSWQGPRSKLVLQAHRCVKRIQNSALCSAMYQNVAYIASCGHQKRLLGGMVMCRVCFHDLQGLKKRESRECSLLLSQENLHLYALCRLGVSIVDSGELWAGWSWVPLPEPVILEDLVHLLDVQPLALRQQEIDEQGAHSAAASKEQEDSASPRALLMPFACSEGGWLAFAGIQTQVANRCLHHMQIHLSTLNVTSQSQLEMQKLHVCLVSTDTVHI